MDKEHLISLYCDKKMTLRQVSKMVNMYRKGVRDILVSCGIKIERRIRNVKRIETKCTYCQKPIERYPSTLCSGKRGNFCSYNCIHSWQREGGMAKENSPAWRGGITAISSDNLKTQEFRELKNIILIKFPLCVMCGDVSYLHVHHIKTRREYPELVFDKSNLITLCRSCHSTIKGQEKKWEDFFVRIICKSGELLENPNVKVEGNQQPSQSNVVCLVDWKVQRLIGEDTQSNKPNTSAAPERDDIVRAYGKP